LLHDGAFGFAGGGRSGEAGAPAVLGELTRIEAECFRIAFHHNPHTFAGKPFGHKLVVGVHDPKQGQTGPIGQFVCPRSTGAG